MCPEAVLQRQSRFSQGAKWEEVMMYRRVFRDSEKPINGEVINVFFMQTPKKPVHIMKHVIEIQF
jgi:hypothetical protein